MIIPTDHEKFRNIRKKGDTLLDLVKQLEEIAEKKEETYRKCISRGLKYKA